MDKHTSKADIAHKAPLNTTMHTDKLIATKTINKDIPIHFLDFPNSFDGLFDNTAENGSLIALATSAVGAIIHPVDVAKTRNSTYCFIQYQGFNERGNIFFNDLHAT